VKKEYCNINYCIQDVPEQKNANSNLVNLKIIDKHGKKEIAKKRDPLGLKGSNIFLTTDLSKLISCVFRQQLQRNDISIAQEAESNLTIQSIIEEIKVDYKRSLFSINIKANISLHITILIDDKEVYSDRICGEFSQESAVINIVNTENVLKESFKDLVNNIFINSSFINHLLNNISI